MREIVITPRIAGTPVTKTRWTVLGHGLTGSGKTRFLASMPRPLIIAAGDESGWTTIETMDPQLFWDPKIAPRVLAIDKVEDMPQAIAQARKWIAAGLIESVGVDSATFYADLYLNHIKTSTPGIDNRQAYGTLGSHLRDVRINVHGLGEGRLNVMWTALTTAPDKEDATDLARPMIPGKEGDKFAASCDLVFYFVQKPLPPRPGQAAQIKFEIRTRRHGKAIARGRDSGVLPDPLPAATWREMLAVLQRGQLSALPPPPTDEELAAAEAVGDSQTENAPATFQAGGFGPVTVQAPQAARPQVVRNPPRVFKRP